MSSKEFEGLLAKDLPALNETLKGGGKEPIPPPPAKVAVNEQPSGAGAKIEAALFR